MSKIICNRVDFVFVSEIQTMDSAHVPVLKEGTLWKPINGIEKPVYQSNVKQQDAGSVNEETLSVKSRRNNLTELLISFCGFYTVLRIGSDAGLFYAGSPDYPCILEYASDGVFDSFLFHAASPA